ncbi:fungal Zn binuclear cluster domain-containing protein [Blastomyces dermatitidis ATCC 18188]|uniref:Fungal Zn binuclear cluster domain-containing protein n=1 Tax=Ajellomyces dermatitidis (strain ATCC 18188 / CBS 674.68) TaxID=653446 RepID=F2TG21_AJEDA|nr:fungal Zn binuclear cluster domain-containing protein [Blastomyces dermatitidis ATCC 18188]
MHSLRSTGLPLPFTPFGQAHGSSSDPLRFPLNLNLSGEPCNPNLRAPYLSPPMSGTPSPESRFDSLLGDRRRKRSNSPITSTTHGNVQPLLSYAESPARAPGLSAILPDSQRLPTGQPGMSIIGLPAIHGPQLQHTLQSGSLLPPRTTTLPPRSTRRAKAHVASACVNCKRKHLGCDSARPCRRCISAGKEESCVDVRHKRRGRPPLKVEEGPLQPYEPTFSHSGVSCPEPQSSSPASQFYGHRRTSSSREIRPITEVRLPRRSSEVGVEYGPPMPNPAMPNPHMWVPPDPSRGIHTSTAIPSPFSSQMALSSGSSQRSPTHNSPLFSPGAVSSSTFTPEYRDVSSSIPPFYGERIPPNQPPRQYQRRHRPPPPTGSAYFGGPGSAHGPLSSPPLSAPSSARNYPFSSPGQSQIQLPPLMPSKRGSEFEFTQGIQRPPVPTQAPSLLSLQPGRPNPGRDDHAQELEDHRSLPAHPPFQPVTFSSGPSGRGRLDPYRPLQQGTVPQGKSSFLTSHTQPALEDKNSAAKEKEEASESRPIKRHKMALGDMVND